jgi:thiamine-phosphate pyrophosphorylase
LGPHRILGVSCYNEIQRAEAAAQAGADYLAVGSVFASATKPQATRSSLDMLTETKRRFGLPVAAIGGITLDNAPQVINAGADMLAVVSDLFNAMNIKGRAEAFQTLWSKS